MPKISIIVPVYNVEKYLSKCIESIILQSLQEIEIICIDDGSTDSSGCILDDYANKDARIKVVHKSNGGYGAAMNVGLNVATGEYIGIVESDDKIDSCMYEELYNKAEENDLDFVKSEAFYWYEEIGYLKRIHVTQVEGYFDRVLGDNDRNLFFDFFMNIWTGMYKKDFLDKNDIRFNETSGASYQDNGFWMQTCLYARKAMWLDKAYYYYRQDNPEASVKSKSKIMAMPLEYDYLEQLLIKRQQFHLLPYCYSMKMVRLKGVYFRIADEEKYEFSSYLKDCYDKLKGYVRTIRYIDSFFRKCISNPEGYAKTITDKKQSLRKKIKESDGLVIYGAGKYGDIAIRNLYNEGLYDDIKCFAVSEIPEKKEMAGKNILQIADAIYNYPNRVVLIAVTPNSEAHKKIEEILDMFHVDNRMYITDILENFYIL